MYTNYMNVTLILAHNTKAKQIRTMRFYSGHTTLLAQAESLTHAEPAFLYLSWALLLRCLFPFTVYIWQTICCICFIVILCIAKDTEFLTLRNYGPFHSEIQVCTVKVLSF